MSKKDVRFRTQYEREPVKSNHGSRIRVTFGAEYDSDGNIVLFEKGKENLYELIQSHKDSVDIHVLLKRYANGDVSALSQRQGAYGDFTDIPSSYADMLNKINSCRAEFEALPVEIRAKFDHDIGKYISTYGSVDFLEKLGIEIKENKVAEPAPEQTAAVKEE